MKKNAIAYFKFFITAGSMVILGTADVYANDAAAASCSAAHIQQAISAVVSSGGGTVSVPACSGGTNGSTWQNNDCVCFYSPTAEVRIVGAGETATDIHYASGAKPPSSCSCGGHSTGSPSGMAFQAHGAGFKEFGNMSISGNDDDANAAGGGMEGGLFIHACEGAGMTNVRVHHARFRRPLKYSGGLLRMCQNPNATMLIDHVFIGDQYYASGTNYGAYGITIKGPNVEWSEPVSGFGSANAVYIEDSTFDYIYHSIAGFGTTRAVVRYNTFGAHRSSAMEQHGPSYGTISCCEGAGNGCTGWGADQGCYAGSYRMEVYNNTFQGPTYGIYIRTGHWIVTENTFTGYTGTDHYPVQVVMEGSSAGSLCTVANGCPHVTGFAASGSCPSSGNGCWHNPHLVYMWNNTYANPSNLCSDQGAHNGECVTTGHQCIRFGTEVFNRAPQTGDPEITSYTKYQYPHPLSTGGIGGGGGIKPLPPQRPRFN